MNMKKTISLILAMIMSVSILFGVSANAYASQKVTGVYNYEYAMKVLDEVNKERTANGIGKLTMSKTLTECAMLRAAEISVEFSHTRPNGDEFYSVVNWVGTVGENIAAGQLSPAAIVENWMNSPGHRANILAAEFRSLGVGCFTDGNDIYWVQLFDASSVSPYNRTDKVNVNVEVSTTSGVESKVNGSTPNKGAEQPDKIVIDVVVPSKTSFTSIKGKSKAIALKWNKKSCNGYQIRYSTSSNMKGAKTVTIKNKKTVAKTITGLKANKKYYVQIRTYKTANNKKVCSKWSSKKAVKTK